MIIRDAVHDDLPAILEIHNDAIRTTTAIWDEHEVDSTTGAPGSTRAGGRAPGAGRRARRGVTASRRTARGAPKTGYRFTVENSVYVHPDTAAAGPRSPDAGADRPRTRRRRARDRRGHRGRQRRSIALHEKFGFRRVALLPRSASSSAAGST